MINTTEILGSSEIFILLATEKHKTGKVNLFCSMC